jgi:hypothetical protein
MKRITIVIVILTIILITCALYSYQIDNFSVNKGPVTILFLNPPEGSDADTGTILGNKVLTCDDGDSESAQCNLTYERI